MVANSFILMKMRSKQECRQVKMSRKTTGKRLIWQGIIVLEIVAIALCLVWGAKTLNAWLGSHERDKATSGQIEQQSRAIAAALSRKDQAETAKLVGSVETAKSLIKQTEGQQVTLPKRAVNNESGAQYLVTFQTSGGQSIYLRLRCTKNLSCTGSIP